MGIMSITEVGIYTVEDLYAYREQRGDMTVQLIAGELVVSPSPSVQHQVVQSRLFAALFPALPPSLQILAAPLDVRVAERTVLQPDLLVIDRSIQEGGEVTVPPVLVVEILSPSSRRTDLVAKPQAMARFGVEHYWVVDPVLPAIWVMRLREGAFETTHLVEGESLMEITEPFPVSLRPTDLRV